MHERRLEWHFLCKGNGISTSYCQPHVRGVGMINPKCLQDDESFYWSSACLREVRDITYSVRRSSWYSKQPTPLFSKDPNDCEPITPSHLLQQRQGRAVPSGLLKDLQIYLHKQWQQAQVLPSHFWAHWVREYLSLLQEQKKWMMKKRNLTVNNLVLLVDVTQPRGHWNLGKVTKVFFGAVKTKTSTFVRPISKLCLLEEAT